jgi:integrase/recombinase XerD
VTISNDALHGAFLHHVRDVRKRRPGTVDAYAKTLTYWADFLGTESSLTATTLNVEQFLLRPILARGRRGNNIDRGRAPATIRAELAALSGLYGWAISRRLRPDDPTFDITPPKLIEAEPRPADESIWTAVWYSPLDDGLRVALALSHFCGLRAFEVASLTHHSFADDLNTFRVLRKGGATRTVHFRDSIEFFSQTLPGAVGDTDTMIYQPLQRLMALQWPGNLFGWKGGLATVTPQSFNRRLCVALRQVGAPNGFGPHQLRHSFCTELVEAGVPIEQVRMLADHKSIQTTQRYVRVAESPLRALLKGPTVDPRSTQRY